MIWVDVIVVLILFFSFVAGLKGGAVNGFFSLLTLIIAIPVAGTFYGFLASYLSFLPGEDWSNFLGFLGTFIVVSIILSLIFWIPRHFTNFAWNSGCLFRLIGGVFILVNAATGLTLIVILFRTFPVIPWLNNLFADTTILSWLVRRLDFIGYLLPVVFQSIPPTY